MRKEYNFKNAKRGKFFKPKKVQKTLRLDQEIIDFYKRLSEKEGIPYQSLINMTLRKVAVEGGELKISLK
ncbi:MAG: antitoxin [Bradymonadales bacterium]|nr:MAG: antitoxin [Bradymonadales bacterium]